MDLADLKATAIQYDQAKTERLAADRAVKLLKTKEDELGLALVAHCREQGAGVDLAEVVIEYDTKLSPVANDWVAIHEYIKKYDAIDLVQKRLTESAVNLRWDDGIVIPGVGDKLVEKIKVIIRG